MVKFTAKVKEAESYDACMQFIMLMLHARTTAHIKHWLTGSRSDHLALQNFYEDIVPLIDDFVESYQGEYGKIVNFPTTYEYPTDTPLAYISMLCSKTDGLRRDGSFPQESWIQNQVDGIRQLLSQLRYQLAKLK